MRYIPRFSESIRSSGIVLALVTAVVTLAVAPPALAQSEATSTPVATTSSSQTDSADEIRAMLKKRDEQIKSILSGSDDYTDEQRTQLKTLINGVIDFGAMGEQALGPFWDDLSGDQRTEFVDVFRDIVRAQSLADLDVYNSTVTYDSITVDGDSAYVRTMTEYQGTRTPVEYVLERQDDEWLAEDIIVDGVSTAGGYARSFQTVVRKRGFDALMQSLKKKREQVTS